jgi:hypothetical protein
VEPRFQDLGPRVISELAESQAIDAAIMSAAGHVSPKMLAHYSHVCIEVKCKALDTLARGRLKEAYYGDADGGYDTNDDTKSAGAAGQGLQVIENMVELVGIEPTTSSLRTMRSPS